MFIELSKGNCNTKLTFEYPLNLVIGDSATGKTNFVESVRKYRKYVNTDASNIVINPIGIDYKTLSRESIVLIDSDSVVLDDIKGISNCKRDDITFVIFGRKFAKNLPFAIFNVYELVTENKVTINRKMYSEEMFSLRPFTSIVVEDKCSGYKFFRSIFRDTDTTDGNGNILKYINSDRLLICDSVGFGGYIEEFMKKANNKNTPYILYRSFEGFILSEKYDDNDTPKVIRIEDDLVKRLQSYRPGYSKSIGCTGDACVKCKQACHTTSKELLETSSISSILGLKIKKSCLASVIEDATKYK